MIPLGRALTVADAVIARLRDLSDDESIETAGGLRRGEELVEDVRVVAPTLDPASVLDALQDGASTRVLQDERRVYAVIDNVPVTVYCPPVQNAGAYLLHLTGTDVHIDQLRRLASGRGWSLRAEGLRTNNGASLIAARETDIYSALDLPWIPPELREGTGEIEAASSGSLPSLVEQSDIRGDLHLHTNASDGRDDAETMVRAAAALSYDYVAITDHSPSSAASRNLSTEAIAQQADEIARLREQYAPMTILHGCEVDILPDGTLDFSDRILERLDLVLASLHDESGHSPERLLRRYEQAMRHPLVTIVTHPTNRMVPHRRGYDIDYERLFETAVETGTLLEIDGAPAHLDLDGPLARRAISAGVTLTVDSDAHRADALGRHMRLGVMMARRGWVEPRHVLNTRSMEEVRTFIARKRDRQSI